VYHRVRCKPLNVRFACPREAQDRQSDPVANDISVTRAGVDLDTLPCAVECSEQKA
jgi:hypothetical protein